MAMACNVKLSKCLMELKSMQVSIESKLSSLGPAGLAAIKESAEKGATMRAALQFTKVLPSVMKYLPLESVLECRLINKFTNTYIEKTLQESSADCDLDIIADPIWIDYNGSNPQPLRWDVCEKYEVLSLDDLKRLVQYFGLHDSDSNAYQNNRHPFIGGFLSIKLGITGVDSKFEGGKALKDLMKRFGEKLNTLCLTLDKGVLGKTVPRAFYTLRTAKNIHALRIDGVVPKDEISYFDKFNVPELPHLKFLDLMSLEGLGDTEGVHGRLIIPFLQRYTSQLERFCCNGKQVGYRLVTVDSLEEALSNLRCFKLYYDDNRRSLVKLAMVKLPRLEHLAIEANNADGRLNNSSILVDILRLVSNVAKKLQVLEIMIEFTCPSAYADPRVNPEWRKQLPNIKKVKVFLMSQHEKWFWQFLLDSCRNVEKLEFYIEKLEDWLPGGDKEIFCQWAFRELPKLTKVSYRCKHCPDILYYRPRGE